MLVAASSTMTALNKNSRPELRRTWSLGRLTASLLMLMACRVTLSLPSTTLLWRLLCLQSLPLRKIARNSFALSGECLVSQPPGSCHSPGADGPALPDDNEEGDDT